MLFSAVNPVAFEIGNLSVRWYGIVIVLGMIIGLAYACRQSHVIKLTIDDTIELFLWIVPLAVVFARLLYVIVRPSAYFAPELWEDFGKGFINMIAVWEGGLTIIGGILGGILGGIFFTIRHRKQINFGNVADIVIVPLLTGQIVGRLGNFFNQEAFGIPIDNPHLQTFPFAVYIDSPSGVETKHQAVVDAALDRGQELFGERAYWFAATFFYEMVWNTIGLFICYAFWKKGSTKKYPGLLLIFYMFWYALGRAWIDSIRMDGLLVTQIACGIVAPLGLIAMICYVLLRNSQLSYRRIRALKEANELGGAMLTEFDVKNYVRIGNILKNEKNPLRILYGAKKPYLDVDFDSLDYYHVPKDYKKIFKNAKNEVYVLAK
ncbi:MAG: prolipoprotein diacylglyceryl transferase [Clostridia bacterium]|nr:prolipoprotein diacylglyceryl transferase [Clostridia bacterium]